MLEKLFFLENWMDSSFEEKRKHELQAKLTEREAQKEDIRRGRAREDFQLNV